MKHVSYELPGYAVAPATVSLWETTTVIGPKVEGAEEWRERLEKR